MRCHASGAMQATKLSKYPGVCRWLGYGGTPPTSGTLFCRPNTAHGQEDEDEGPDECGTGSSSPSSPEPYSPPHPTPDPRPQYMDEKMKVLMKESPWAPLTIVKGGQVREGGGRGGGGEGGGRGGKGGPVIA